MRWVLVSEKYQNLVPCGKELAGATAENLAAGTSPDGQQGLAGRELDVKIHRDVMQREARWSAVIHGDWMDLSRGHSTVPVPRYSDDFAEAMLVVGEILRRDHGWTFHTQGHGWEVEVFPLPDSGYEGVKVGGTTLPEAICRAALILILKVRLSN
jgi:hypothetical protein